MSVFEVTVAPYGLLAVIALVFMQATYIALFLACKVSCVEGVSLLLELNGCDKVHG